MKQVMNCHKDNGLLNMIRRTDPMITQNSDQGKNLKILLLIVQNNIKIGYGSRGRFQ